jgi:hypothetical protein
MAVFRSVRTLGGRPPPQPGTRYFRGCRHRVDRTDVAGSHVRRVGGGSGRASVAAGSDLSPRRPGFKSTADLATRVVLIHSRTRVLTDSASGCRGGRHGAPGGRRGLSLSHQLARVNPTRSARRRHDHRGRDRREHGRQRPNPILRHLPTGHVPGLVLPDATFAVPGLDGVWALGDCARRGSDDRPADARDRPARDREDPPRPATCSERSRATRQAIHW